MNASSAPLKEKGEESSRCRCLLCYKISVLDVEGKLFDLITKERQTKFIRLYNEISKVAYRFDSNV